jgi:hypothetical protein
MVRSAFAGWVVAVHGAYGTRRIGELRGWAMRTPLLALGLIVVAAAGIGWPGLLAWDSRLRLIQLTVPGPIGLLILLGAVAPIAIYARLLAVGVGPPTDHVTAGHGERPNWPAPLPSRPMRGRGGTERAFERTSHALGGSLDLLWTVPAGLRSNRSLIAGVLVLALAGLSFVVAAGGLGVPVAAAIPAQSAEPTGSEPPASEAPSGSETPAGSEGPGATAPVSAAPSGGPPVEPSPSAVPSAPAPAGASSPVTSRPPGPAPSFQPLPTF